MSKLKQSMAVTIMLAGLILYTVPVQSAPCFLPAGSEGCEAGGVDIASDNGSDETCEGYNISENTRNSKQYSSGCYSCSACTNKAGKKMYKCEAVSNATWDNSHGVCCTNGETYDVAERKCCPNGGCVHDDCEEPKIWSPSLQSCECPSNRDENDAGECCNVGEHADGSICCPTNKHNQNGTCVCDDGYIPDGTGCKIPNCTGYDVTDTSKYDTNCYVCEACADDGKKFKCTQSIKDGYQLDSGKCVKKETAQTCENMGYKTDSCGSCERAYKTGYTDADGVACYRCEAYDCSKTCSQLNSSWISENVGCKSTKTGWHSTMDVVMDDAYEFITGSDGDCNICGEERNIYTITPKNSDCYDIVSITGSEVTKSGNVYKVPYGAEFTVTTKKNANTSRLCMRANDSLSVNGETGFVLEDHSSTFTLNEAFLDDVKVSKNNNASFAVAAMEEKEKITYAIQIDVERGSTKTINANADGYHEESYFSIYVTMPNASKDSFMNGSDLYGYISLHNRYNAFGVSMPSAYPFDGKRYTIIEKNYDDLGGACNGANIDSESVFKLYFQGKDIKLKEGCTQLGTAEDNTEVCIEIDNNANDQTSSYCGHSGWY